MRDIVEACDRTWRSLGVDSVTREELATELRDDLSAAEADGLGPEALIGTDVRRFAEEWARERGATRTRPLLGQVAMAAAVGCVLTWLPLAFHINPSWLRHLLASTSVPPRSLLGVLLLYGMGWLWVVVPVVVLVWVVLLGLEDDLRRRTVLWLTLLCPLWFVAAVEAAREVTHRVGITGNWYPHVLAFSAVVVLATVLVRWVVVAFSRRGGRAHTDTR
jgi:hypothetical protein